MPNRHVRYKPRGFKGAEPPWVDLAETSHFWGGGSNCTRLYILIVLSSLFYLLIVLLYIVEHGNCMCNIGLQRFYRTSVGRLSYICGTFIVHLWDEISYICGMRGHLILPLSHICGRTVSILL